MHSDTCVEYEIEINKLHESAAPVCRPFMRAKRD